MTALLTTLIWSLTEKNKKALYRIDVSNMNRIFHLKRKNPKWDQRAPENEKWHFLCCFDLISSQTTMLITFHSLRRSLDYNGKWVSATAHSADGKPALISKPYWDLICNNYSEKEAGPATKGASLNTHTHTHTHTHTQFCYFWWELWNPSTFHSST